MGFMRNSHISENIFQNKRCEKYVNSKIAERKARGIL